MEDKIEEIPTTMEKFFACSGKMVKPSSWTVKTILETIPEGSLVTLEQLREKLAKDFSIDSACPASTMKALKALSQEKEPVCYWRVIRKKGELVSLFHGGVEGHGHLLEKEGFELDFTRKNPVVKDYESKLSRFS